jgi:hypothetical protein
MATARPLPSVLQLLLAARLTREALNAAALVGLGLLAVALLPPCIVQATVIDLTRKFGPSRQRVAAATLGA